MLAQYTLKGMLKKHWQIPLFLLSVSLIWLSNYLPEPSGIIQPAELRDEFGKALRYYEGRSYAKCEATLKPIMPALHYTDYGKREFGLQPDWLMGMTLFHSHEIDDYYYMNKALDYLEIIEKEIQYEIQYREQLALLKARSLSEEEFENHMAEVGKIGPPSQLKNNQFQEAMMAYAAIMEKRENHRKAADIYRQILKMYPADPKDKNFLFSKSPDYPFTLYRNIYQNLKSSYGVDFTESVSPLSDLQQNLLFRAARDANGALSSQEQINALFRNQMEIGFLAMDYAARRENDALAKEDAKERQSLLRESQKLYSRARAELTMAVRSFPSARGVEEGYLRLGDCHLKLGNPVLAGDAFQEASATPLMIRPVQEAILKIGELLRLHDKKYPDAIAYYRKIQRPEVDDDIRFAALLREGDALYSDLEYGASLNRYIEALGMLKEKPEIINNPFVQTREIRDGLRDLIGRTASPEEEARGLEAFASFCSAQPNNVVCAQELATLYHQYGLRLQREQEGGLGANAAAIEQFRKAGEICKNIFHASRSEKIRGEASWQAGEFYFAAGYFPGSIYFYQQFLNGNNSDTRVSTAMFRIGNAHQELREFSKAIAVFERVKKEFPDQLLAIRSQFEIARCREFEGRDRWAQKEYKKLFKILGNGDSGNILDPDSAIWRDAELAVGSIHYAHDEFPQAQRYFGRAIERYGSQDPTMDSPAMNHAKYKLAVCCFKNGEFEKASRYFNDIIVLQPHKDIPVEMHEKAYFWLGDSYLRRAYVQETPQKRDELFTLASKAYDSALNRYSRSNQAPWAYFQLGNILNARGDDMTAAKNSAAAENFYKQALVKYEQAAFVFPILPSQAFETKPMGLDKNYWGDMVDWVRKFREWENSGRKGPAPTT